MVRALPAARISILEGQEHLAMYGDPEGFAAELVRFAEEGDGGREGGRPAE